MAFHDAHTVSVNDLSHRILDGIKSGFSAIGAALVSVANANHRVRLVQRLSEKSDAELAELGIRREDIVRHVFNDVLHV